MAELTKEELDQMNGDEYVEDEFGLGLKGYLLVRAVLYCIAVFMVLGGLLALVTGATTINDLVSNSTGLKATSNVLNDNFSGLQICMFAQAFYVIASLVVVVLFYIKRTKLFAFIDVGLFILYAAVFFIMGSFDLLAPPINTWSFGAVSWPLLFLLNPIFSFIALFVGKHFPYMPMK